MTHHEHLVQACQRLLDGPRGGDPHRDARRAQRLDVLPAVLLLVRDDEVGAERQDLLDPRVLAAADPGDVEVRWVGAVVGRTDQQPGSRDRNGLGQRRDQRDDPARWPRRGDRRAEVVTQEPAQTSVTRMPAWALYRRFTEMRFAVNASTCRALRSRPA